MASNELVDATEIARRNRGIFDGLMDGIAALEGVDAEYALRLQLWVNLRLVGVTEQVLGWVTTYKERLEQANPLPENVRQIIDAQIGEEMAARRARSG